MKVLKMMILLYLVLGINTLFAQVDEHAQNVPPSQLLLATGLSSFPFLIYSLEQGVENYNQASPFSSPVGRSYFNAFLPVLEPLPMFFLDSPRATNLALGGLATYSIAEGSTLLPVPDNIQTTLFNLNWKYGMYTTYEIYKESRSRSTDESYRSFKQYSFQEITFAPFNPESYANPLSLSLIPIMVLGEGVSKYFGSGTKDAVFSTGRTYFGDNEYNPWVGASMAGVNAALIAIQNSYEEAYWRGFVYEEAKHSFQGNWIWATLLTNTLFALWHIPNQGLNWSIAGAFMSGAAATWAYELGGLPAAGAAHGIVNAFSSLIDFSLFGGSPKTNSLSSTVGAAKAVTSNAGQMATLSFRLTY